MRPSDRALASLIVYPLAIVLLWWFVGAIEGVYLDALANLQAVLTP